MNTGEFLSMGGYAAFVWPSLGLTLFALVWNAVAARRLLDAARRDARRRLGLGGAP